MKRIFAISSLILATGIATVLLVVWLQNRTELTLPAPTGSFAAGRTTYVWSDDAPDKLAPQAGTIRELFAWIWYPTEVPTKKAKSEYLPAAWRAAIDGRNNAVLSSFFNRDLSRIYAHAIPDTEIASRQNRYPVVIMRAGLAGMVSSYTVLAENLASHGYIVVGFDVPYRTQVVVFPDGRVISRTHENNVDAFSGAEAEALALKLTNAWSADVGFALDKLAQLNAAGKFAGRIDLSRVGVFGHSLGGATALQFCHDDVRCKAVIDIDGAPRGTVVKEGLKQPTLFLLSDHGDLSKGPEQAIDADVRAIYNSVPPDRRKRIVIRGSHHFLFGDGAVTKSSFFMGMLRLCGMFDIDGARQLEITNYYVRSFFDSHLKDLPATELWIQPSRYKEVEYVE